MDEVGYLRWDLFFDQFRQRLRSSKLDMGAEAAEPYCFSDEVIAQFDAYPWTQDEKDR